jgi:hypothetical protein
MFISLLPTSSTKNKLLLITLYKYFSTNDISK